MNYQINVDLFAQGAQWPLLQLSVNTPPYVPNRNFGNLQNYIGYISAAAAIEIQNQVQRNPLRMFMFNIAAQNNFQNEYFESVISGIAGAAELLVATGQLPNMEQAIQRSIPYVISLMAGANVREFPRLQAFLGGDQSLLNEIQQNINTYDQIGQQVNAMRQGRIANVQQQGGMNFTGWNGGAQHQQQVQQQQQATWGQGNMGWNSAQPMSAGGNPIGARFGGSAVTQPANNFVPAVRVEQAQAVASPTSYASRYQRPDAETAPPPQQQKEVAMNTSEQEQTVERIPNTPENFRSSPDFPYFVAYDPHTTRAELEVINGTITIPHFFQRDPENMNYDEHATTMTTTGFGAAPESLDLHRANVVLMNVRTGIDRINNEAVVTAAGVDDAMPAKLNIAISDQWITEPSETTAWVNASARRLEAAQKHEGLHVYRVYAIIAKPVIGDTDETSSIEKLGNSMTYASLSDNLKASFESLSPALYNTINRKMTVVVNRSLRQELGLRPSEMSISNFRDDINALLELLDETYGSTMKAGFLSRQRDNIRNALMTMTPSMADDLTDNTLTGLEFTAENRPKITYLTSNYSMTYINCLGWEIGVELVEDGIPTLITNELVPTLYGLLKGIFDDAANYTIVENNKPRSTIARHLIRTRDGRILEATRGALLDDSYLLSILE